jgi:hypothetical protein
MGRLHKSAEVVLEAGKTPFTLLKFQFHTIDIIVLDIDTCRKRELEVDQSFFQYFGKPPFCLRSVLFNSTFWPMMFFL